MLKVNRKEKERKERKKERKKEEKHTNSIARIRPRASRPTVSFAYLKLHHAAKTPLLQWPTFVM